jgi:hypothetical protein
MWCLEVIKHMNKPKTPKDEENSDKEESKTEPREDQARPS